MIWWAKVIANESLKHFNVHEKDYPVFLIYRDGIISWNLKIINILKNICRFKNESFNVCQLFWHGKREKMRETVNRYQEPSHACFSNSSQPKSFKVHDTKSSRQEILPLISQGSAILLFKKRTTPKMSGAMINR